MQVYKLPKNNDLNIFIETNNLVINSPYENHPLFTLGYHYFIGRTRDEMALKNHSASMLVEIHIREFQLLQIQL